MGDAGFAYVWEYRVRGDREEGFLRLYGPQGSWVRLFQQAEGYVRTVLCRDPENPGRYLTVDYWVSRKARDRFVRDFSSQFADLDRQGEATTIEERFIGDFEVVG